MKSGHEDPPQATSASRSGLSAGSQRTAFVTFTSRAALAISCRPASSLYSGSSPRVRGTQSPAARRGFLTRVIPACARNAPPAARLCSHTAGHPRVCGERMLAHQPSPLTTGSSPRVRGTRGVENRTEFGGRVIPACAGNACCPRPSGERESGHPRLCGESLPVKSAAAPFFGSSPRVRGTLRRQAFHKLTGRVIPACAGNANRWWPRPRSPAGHPRVCGERTSAPFASRMYGGSSPRVRGTLQRLLAFAPQHRVIPACAGNAASRRAPVRVHAGHPRVCGERFFRRNVPWGGRGSSPRVRGTRLIAAGNVIGARVIPACAGNANRPIKSPTLATGHPRVCGERPLRGHTAGTVAGSSPRVRGTPRRSRAAAHQYRVIPACAGNAGQPGSSPPRSPGHPRVCGERSCWRALISL